MSPRPRAATSLLAALALLVALLAATPGTADAAKKKSSARKAGRHAMTAWKHGKRHHRLLGFKVRRKPSSGSGSAAATPSSAPAAPAASASRTSPPLFGVHTERDPYYGDTKNTDALEGRLNRRIDIVHWFQNWAGDDWISQMHPEVFGAVTGGGRLPLLTWMPADGSVTDQRQDAFRLEALASGRYDDYIARTARSLRDIGGPIYLRPMHEFNGNWSPWGAATANNTPARFVDAWRHMHDVFVREGASNVRWVWCPMAESTPNTKANQFENYYPGADYVDVLSLDGYNWGSGRPDMGGWRSFKQIFAEPVARLQALGSQPIWLAEVGSSSEGGDKAEWVRDMWRAVDRMPQVAAVVWFDQNKEQDWRAASSSAVASAFAN